MEIGTSRNIARPTRLNTLLVDYLNPEDFVRIGEEIGIDPDNIYGDKEPMARKILQYAKRHGQIIKLFIAIVDLNIQALSQEDLKPYYGSLYLPSTHGSIEKMRVLGERTNIHYDSMLVGGMGWSHPSSNKDVIAEQCWEIYVIYQALGTHHGMVSSTFSNFHEQDLITLGWL